MTQHDQIITLIAIFYLYFKLKSDYYYLSYYFAVPQKNQQTKVKSKTKVYMKQPSQNKQERKTLEAWQNGDLLLYNHFKQIFQQKVSTTLKALKLEIASLNIKFPFQSSLVSSYLHTSKVFVYFCPKIVKHEFFIFLDISTFFSCIFQQILY